MKRTGFKDVHLESLKVPVGGAHKDRKQQVIGTLVRKMLLDHLEGLSLGLFTRYLNWSADEVRAYLVDVRKELKSTGPHGYSTR